MPINNTLRYKHKVKLEVNYIKDFCMYITPAIPESSSIKLDTFLFKKAEEIVMKSARLTGGHNKQFILAIKDLLKITNSYYSNLIESEGTHPFDIEKAMKKDFSSEKKKKDLQQLSLVHWNDPKLVDTFLFS